MSQDSAANLSPPSARDLSWPQTFFDIVKTEIAYGAAAEAALRLPPVSATAGGDAGLERDQVKWNPAYRPIARPTKKLERVTGPAGLPPKMIPL
jgi:hypothetical protein